MWISFRFPSRDLQPELFLNRGPRTTFFALKLEVSPACAVDQVIHILQSEPAQTLIKIEREEDFIISSALKDSELLKDRVSF